MTTNDRYDFDVDRFASARLRAGDADRESTAEQLRSAHAEGRIDSDELSERLGRCFASKTYGELERLTVDLTPAARVPGPRRLDRAGRHPGHRIRLVLAAIVGLWLLAHAAGAGWGHAHPHPSVFPFLLVLVFAFLVTRLVRAVRA